MAIRRALLSVSNKEGIIELARFLLTHDVEILSTGGTATHLREAGVAVTSVADWSGAPEILGGRVKTLTPRVFGAILHDRDNEGHRAECASHDIPSIDLVAVNLYPFEATVARLEVTLAEAIEQIDVGGPSLLRAAAKNHRHVVVLCDPSLYGDFMREMETGTVSDAFRRRAAIEVFRRTSLYDAAIAGHLRASVGDDDPMPEMVHLPLRRAQELRYGENPQQEAAFYLPWQRKEMPFTQLQGKELSYNNLIDLDAAFRLSNAFQEPACAIIKHTNPCGAARAGDTAEAVRLALESDPVSAFGGIVGLNRELDEKTARLLESIFLEVIVAPSYAQEALEILQARKNLRLIAASDLPLETDVRTAAGGFLLQSPDRISPIDSWKSVTSRPPSAAEMHALEFAWTVCAHVKSNAIVLARESQSIGIGAGQMSRVDSARLAITKAALPTGGCVAASDAFFPFRDGLDILAAAGISAIVQPGGSIRDAEVIAGADEQGLAMVFTGERHFRH